MRMSFWSSVTSSFWTVTIPEGYYVNSFTLIGGVVSALNTVTGSSGLTFSENTITLNPDAYTLSATGGNFYFLNIIYLII